MAVPWPEIAAHRERLVRVARRRVPTWEDAEDVASEAMLRAATYEDLDVERLPQFLSAVTVRLCADVYRSAERGTRLVRRLGLDDEPSPEELACEASDRAVVRELVGRLPDSQRNVLVDRAYGLSVTQISQRHSLSYKAVESALSRARSTLRSALAAATALALGAAATLRRRPGLEVAVPAASIAFVTAVVAPFLANAPIHGEPVALGPGRVTAIAAGAQPAARPRVAPAVAPAPVPGPATVAAPVRRQPRPEPSPTGTPIDIAVGDGPDKIHVVQDDDGQIATKEELRSCVREGVQVDARVDPTSYPVYAGNVGCGT